MVTRSWQYAFCKRTLKPIRGRAGENQSMPIMTRKTLRAFFIIVSLVAFGQLPSRADQSSEQLYKAKCGACHGADGKGETPAGKANKLRDLASVDVQKQSDADLTAIIANGKNKMPAYGKSLKPEQVKELVGYVRNFAKKP
jgi:cytochrome c6